jgi:hypothetical protein
MVPGRTNFQPRGFRRLFVRILAGGGGCIRGQVVNVRASARQKCIELCVFGRQARAQLF